MFDSFVIKYYFGYDRETMKHDEDVKNSRTNALTVWHLDQGERGPNAWTKSRRLRCVGSWCVDLLER